ncbi:Uncharacterised protein [Klebsiella quasipneumoniae]|nr:Uncharacterised protein [Klebsiella quasipneumoniae]
MSARYPRWYCQLWRRRERIQYLREPLFPHQGKIAAACQDKWCATSGNGSVYNNRRSRKRCWYYSGSANHPRSNEVRRHLFPMAIAGRWPDSRRQNCRRRGYRYHKFQPPGRIYACPARYVHKSGYAYFRQYARRPAYIRFPVPISLPVASLPAPSHPQSELQEDALAERQKLSR